MKRHLSISTYKKIFFSTILLCSELALSATANRIDLTITDSDFSQYSIGKESYSFKGSASISVNGTAAIQVKEMKTRGQGSLSAKRKNLGIDLTQAAEVGTVKGKKINLVNMWVDKGYISTRLGFLTANLLGIGKKQHSEYVELAINGRSNGLYTVVEKPTKVVKDSPLVVRRRGKSTFDLANADVGEDFAADEKSKKAVISKLGKTLQAGYDQIDKMSGEKLWSLLESNMDIKAYMRLMVLNSLYTNGDGADEVFFYVDKDLYQQQGRVYFKVLPWDSDDLFKSMHQSDNANSTNSKYAVKYPTSLIYNYEDKLDRKFADDGFLYAKLKEETKALLSSGGLLDKNHTDSLLEQLKQEISPYLKNQNILQMGALDGGRKNTAYSEKEVMSIFEMRKKQIDTRRLELLKRASQ